MEENIMNLKHKQITMQEIMQNKQAYQLLSQEFSMFMTPTILQNIKPLTLQKVLRVIRPYISKQKLNELLQKLESL